MLTQQQLHLVQESWQRVVPIADQAAALFYGRLFELDPSLKPMFRGDMKEQGRKLMGMVTFAVNGLTRLEALVPGVQALGRRHAGYGVVPADYDTVGAALLWTLGQGLGPNFDEATRDAWAAAYGLLASVMIEASEAVAA